MKILKITILLIISALALSAETKLIGYVQQETAGDLVIVTVSEAKKNAVVVVRSFQPPAKELKEKIKKEEFEAIWNSLHTEDSEAFIKEPENMSDVGFYTIRLMSEKGERTLHIPSSEVPEGAQFGIDQIHSYIKQARYKSR